MTPQEAELILDEIENNSDLLSSDLQFPGGELPASAEEFHHQTEAKTNLGLSALADYQTNNPLPTVQQQRVSTSHLQQSPVYQQVEEGQQIYRVIQTAGSQSPIYQ